MPFLFETEISVMDVDLGKDGEDVKKCLQYENYVSTTHIGLQTKL